MYVKLTIGNGKKAIKDYLLYFITLTLCVSLFYAFSSLSSSGYELITEDSFSFEALKQIMKYASMLITGLLAVLVAYVNKYMMRRRQREFATYILLGSEQRSVALMFFIETLIIGIIAIFMGIFLGTLFSQVVTSLVLMSANQEVAFSLKLYWDTVGLTFIFFITMFCIIGVYNIRAISKIKLIDMLNADKKTEFQFKRSGKLYLIIFILSLICYGVFGVYGYKLIKAKNNAALITGNEMMYIFVCFLTFIIGTYALFYSISYIIIFINKRCLGFKYENTNLVLLGSLVSKIKTTPVLMASIAMTFLGAALSIAGTLLLAQWSLGYLEYRVPYDINIRNDYDVLELEEIPEINYSSLIEKLEYEGYDIKDYVQVEKYIINPEDINNRDPREVPLIVVSLSDYNKAREMLGYDKIKLRDNEFTTHWARMVEKTEISRFIEENSTIEINDKSLKLSGKPYYEESIGEGIYNGYTSNILIVPDGICDELTFVGAELFANTKKNLSYDKALEVVSTYLPNWVDENYEGVVEKYKEQDRDIYHFIDGRVQVKERNNIINITLAMRLLGIYLGIVMLMISLTVLALQQLSDSIEHKSRFRVLKKLGIDNTEINKLILKQISVYFILPVSIAITGFVVFMLNFTNIISQQIQSFIGDKGLILNIGVSSALMILIYGCYFIGTYYSFKRNINEDIK